MDNFVLNVCCNEKKYFKNNIAKKKQLKRKNKRAI